MPVRIAYPNEGTHMRPIPTGFGWRPEPPDLRDYPVSRVLRARSTWSARKPHVDLTNEMPEVFDQGQIGSCVAQSLAALVYQARTKKEGGDVTVPSRPFIYYNSRVREGTIPIDTGQYIRTGAKVLNHEGAAPSYMWSHDMDDNDLPKPGTWEFPKRSRWRKTPTARVYEEAQRWQSLEYYRIETLDEMLDCLEAGFAFVIGFTVYRSFYDENWNPRTFVPIPQPGEQMYGGHAVVVVGYNLQARMFRVRNSWGTNVQDRGHFFMEFDHLTNRRLSSDFWTIREVERYGNRD